MGGQLEIRPIATETTWESYQTVGLYDLVNSSVTVEVVQVTSTYTFLDLRVDGDNNQTLGLWFSYGTLDTWNTSVPYDPVAHRWWRIRETAGTVYWEVSPDAHAWTVLDFMPTPTAVRLVEPACLVMHCVAATYIGSSSHTI